MLKSNQVFLVSYFNLFRSCHCGANLNNINGKTNLMQTLKMFSTAADFYKIGLLSLSAPRCSSLCFHGLNRRNGEYSPKIWRKNPPYIYFFRFPLWEIIFVIIRQIVALKVNTRLIDFSERSSFAAFAWPKHENSFSPVVPSLLNHC